MFRLVLLFSSLHLLAHGLCEECEDYTVLLQRSSARVSKERNTRVDPEAKNETVFAPMNANAADEPDTAPVWYVTFALFFGAGLLILAMMVLMLCCLQIVVNGRQKHEQEMLKSKKVPNGVRADKKVDVPLPPARSNELSADDINEVLNGEGDRLNLLLEIAESLEPEKKATEVVQKGGKANKVKLSPESEVQVVRAVLTLATAVQKMHERRKANVTPRQKLQAAFRQVHLAVRFNRAMNSGRFKDQEDRHVTEVDHTASADATNRYDEGTSGLGPTLVVADRSRLAAYFASEKWMDHAGILLLVIYSQLCGAVYATYLRYRFPKMFHFMGPWVLVSRGEAMSIIVLTALMVLFMSRGFVTWVREYAGWSGVLRNMIDKHTLMHQWCGRLLPVCAALHILGHLFGSIPAIVNETDNAKINEVFTYGTLIKFNFNSWAEAMTCYPFVTGVGLVLLLCCFWALSNEYVRRRWFEAFHYPHLVLIVFWTGGLWAHGARQWLGCGVPLGQLVVFPVVLFYFGTRLSDIMRGIHPNIYIKDATIKKKTVLLEIDTENSGFVYETGMYCMLKVPAISEFEWHPFTIASAGGAPVVQVLFAVVGDWTTRLKELLEECRKQKKKYPVICIRGGYGAPAANMKDSSHVVLVGAGVGATPFLSFLASFCSSVQRGRETKLDAIESAVFYWVSREPEDFVWVNQYNEIINSVLSLKNRIEVRLCLTKSLETATGADCSAAEVAMFWNGVNIALTRFDAPKLASELGAPTQFGRPNWNKELSDHANALLARDPPAKRTGAHGELEIHVYACGNAMLVSSLTEACDSLDDQNRTFRLFAEQF